MTYQIKSVTYLINSLILGIKTNKNQEKEQEQERRTRTRTRTRRRRKRKRTRRHKRMNQEPTRTNRRRERTSKNLKRNFQKCYQKEKHLRKSLIMDSENFIILMLIIDLMTNSKYQHSQPARRTGIKGSDT